MDKKSRKIAVAHTKRGEQFKDSAKGSESAPKSGLIAEATTAQQQEIVGLGSIGELSLGEISLSEAIESEIEETTRGMPTLVIEGRLAYKADVGYIFHDRLFADLEPRYRALGYKPLPAVEMKKRKVSDDSTKGTTPVGQKPLVASAPKGSNPNNSGKKGPKKTPYHPLSLRIDESHEVVVRTRGENPLKAGSPPSSEPGSPRNSVLRIIPGDDPASPLILEGARSTLEAIKDVVPAESIRTLHNSRLQRVYGSAATMRMSIDTDTFFDWCIAVLGYVDQGVSVISTRLEHALRYNFGSNVDSRYNTSPQNLFALYFHSDEEHYWLARSLEAAISALVTCGKATGGAMKSVSAFIARSVTGVVQQLGLMLFGIGSESETTEIVMHDHWQCGKCTKGEIQSVCTVNKQGTYVDSNLLRYLQTYSCLQTRNRNLMEQLRSRCKVYQRDNMVSNECMAKIMPGTIMMAYIRSEWEQAALDLSNSKAFRQTSREFGDSITNSPHSGYWSAWWNNGLEGVANHYCRRVTIVGRQ